MGVSGYIGYPNFVHLLKWLTSGYIVLGMSPLLKLNVDNVGSPASDIEIGKGAPELGALSNLKELLCDFCPNSSSNIRRFCHKRNH